MRHNFSMPFDMNAFEDAGNSPFAQDFKPPQGSAERRAFDALPIEEQRALIQARKADAAREAAKGDESQNFGTLNRPRQRPTPEQPRDRNRRR